MFLRFYRLDLGKIVLCGLPLVFDGVRPLRDGLSSTVLIIEQY